MEVLENNERVCHKCGYDNQSPHDSSYIAPGTVLNNGRYTIGRVLRHNGESALYIAYDNIMGCKVQIREYMPTTICKRDERSANIIVNEDYCVQYKAFMAEFTDLNKSLVKLRNVGNITIVLDIFVENNTSYAVYEYIEGITLLEFLNENMGEISWEETSKLFPPLLTTIGLLHQAGIIHRAISPETIYYTDRKELKLTDFCISAVRTKGTELNAETYKGYSAPEQYYIYGKQGTWTDVYGISAVLYKILTGCMPTDASNRAERDNLCSPTDINLDIPETVSEAIMDGMEVNIDNRIPNVTDLVTKLFKENQKKENFSSTIQIPRRDEYSQEPTPTTEDGNVEEVVEEGQSTLFNKIKFPLMIGVLLLAIILILGIVFVKMFTNTDSNSTSLLQHNNGFKSSDENVVDVTETTTEKLFTYLMKNLIDKDIKDVKNDEDLKDKIKLKVVEEYNDDFEMGKIFEQSVEAGEKYTEGDTITVKVSKGPKTAEVPDYKTGTMSCYTKEEYVKLLESKNIPYELVAVVNRGYYSGYVIGTEPKAGETLDIEGGGVLKVTYTDNRDSDAGESYSVTTTVVSKEQSTTYYDDSDDDEDSSDTSNTYSSSSSSSTYSTSNTYSSTNSSSASSSHQQTEEQVSNSEANEPSYTEPQVTDAEPEPVYTEPQAQDSSNFDDNSNE